jgi:hypothetical protein
MVTRKDMSKKFSKLGKYCLHCKQATMLKERNIMVKVALFIRLEAKPRKEANVENFLRGGLSVV